jgi:hypothetical protein
VVSSRRLDFVDRHRRCEPLTSQEHLQGALVALQASGRALGGSGAALGGSGGALGGPGRGLGGSIYTKTPDQPHQQLLCYIDVGFPSHGQMLPVAWYYYVTSLIHMAPSKHLISIPRMGPLLKAQILRIQHHAGLWVLSHTSQSACKQVNVDHHVTNIGPVCNPKRKGCTQPSPNCVANSDSPGGFSPFTTPVCL